MLKKENFKFLKKLCFLIIFLLGVFLRLWKYPFYPFAGHAEEYLFVWSGLSLIEQKVPISWNDLPVYEKKHIYWEGIAPNPTGGGIGVRLLKPWLDEPPLYSLIVGGMAKLYNLQNFTVISPYVIRIPSLVFSIVTMVFVFLLAKKLFGYWIGLLSLLIYGTVPTIVFGSRLAVPENMITTLMIISLWLILNYFQTGKKSKRNLALLLGIAAGFAKPTGFFLVPFIVFWLFFNHRWKEGILAGIVGSLLYFVPFFTYGFYYDKELFLKVFLYQSRRPSGWSGLGYLITNPGFSIEVFLDGFLILGFFALCYLLFKKRTKEEEIILFSFIFSLFVVIVSGGKHDQLCWYRYPIYPFMAISTALLIKEIHKKPTFFHGVIFIPLFLANADLLNNPFWKLNFFLKPQFYRVIFALLLVPFVFQFFSKKECFVKISRFVILLTFIIGIFLNIWVVKSRFNLLCDNTPCPLPQKIDLFYPINSKIKK